MFFDQVNSTPLEYCSKVFTYYLVLGILSIVVVVLWCGFHIVKDVWWFRNSVIKRTVFVEVTNFNYLEILYLVFNWKCLFENCFVYLYGFLNGFFFRYGNKEVCYCFYINFLFLVNENFKTFLIFYD